jgi:hypothetical protein
MFSSPRYLLLLEMAISLLLDMSAIYECSEFSIEAFDKSFSFGIVPRRVTSFTFIQSIRSRVVSGTK